MDYADAIQDLRDTLRNVARRATKAAASRSTTTVQREARDLARYAVKLAELAARADALSETNG